MKMVNWADLYESCLAFWREVWESNHSRLTHFCRQQDANGNPYHCDPKVGAKAYLAIFQRYGVWKEDWTGSHNDAWDIAQRLSAVADSKMFRHRLPG